MESFPAPKSPPTSSSPSKRQAGGRHHCGRVTAPRAGLYQSPMAQHSTVCTSPLYATLKQTDYSPIFQAKKPRLTMGSALTKGSVSNGRGRDSTQVCCQWCPYPATQENRGQMGPARERQPETGGTLWVRAGGSFLGGGESPESGESCSGICAFQ